ncbi:hypothetical protein FB446DRAFT_221880 [Lentinula raphanica]|nr:hypothetical protein FB446DRAFT_221880 [Lentinula raphanica]
MSNYLDDDYPLDYGDSDSRAGSEGNEYIASIERLSTRPNDGVLEVGPYPTQSPSETFLSTSHEPRHTPHAPPTLHPTQIVNGLDDCLTALSQVLRRRILVQQPPPLSPTTTATTSHPPASRSVMDTISCTPEHSSAHSPFNSPPSYSIHTRSKSTRTSTSSKPSCDSPKSSSVTNHNTNKLLRSPNRRITKSGSASSMLSSSVSYPPSTTLERSPIGKETASARITRVERNTIHVDQRIDLLLSGLETGLEERIAREVDCRVSVAMEMACEQMKKDFLANIAQSTADIHAHQPSPPSSSSLSSTHALLSPATLSLPK